MLWPITILFIYYNRKFPQGLEIWASSRTYWYKYGYAGEYKNRSYVFGIYRVATYEILY